MDFAKFKKSSSDTSKMIKALEAKNAKFAADPRLWYPQLDKAGNGAGGIRFLPAPAVDGDDGVPWVRVYTHSFKGPTGKWYIENDLTTLDKSDPCTDFNTYLWNLLDSNDSPHRKQARAQKRKANYYSNIIVVSDPKNPENEEQHRLFKYGETIFEKIENLMQPEYEGDESINPFDFWNGCNLRLRIKKKDGWTNYDDSKFENCTPLYDGNDDKLKELWLKEYSLAEFVAPKQFKSYEELKARLNEVLGVDVDKVMKGDKELPVSRTAAKSRVDEEAEEVAEDDSPPFDVSDDEMAKYRSLVE